MKADVLVVDRMDGMDIIRMLGRVRINQTGDATCSKTEPCAYAATIIEEPEFNAEFDEQTRVWTSSSKWSDNQPLNGLTNKVPEYPISAQVRQEYNHEPETWLNNGWLLPYHEEKVGSPKSLIPLMVVFQQNKFLVGPVLDFRELNGHVDAYTAHADVCAQKLRESRKKGSNVSVPDLRRAYLQVRVHKSLLPYQTLKVKGTA